VSGEEPLGRQRSCPQPDPGLSSPRFSGSPCVGCARPYCRVTLGPSVLPLGAAPLAANLARVPLLQHYVEVCELVGQRHGHVPKVGLLSIISIISKPASTYARLSFERGRARAYLDAHRAAAESDGHRLLTFRLVLGGVLARFRWWLRMATAEVSCKGMCKNRSSCCEVGDTLADSSGLATCQHPLPNLKPFAEVCTLRKAKHFQESRFP
jgi:hypothetical protein